MGFFAGWLGIRGEITIGELIAVVGVAQFVITPMTMLGKNISSKVASGGASAERIVSVLGDPGRGEGGVEEEAEQEQRARKWAEKLPKDSVTVHPSERGRLKQELLKVGWRRGPGGIRRRRGAPHRAVVGTRRMAAARLPGDGGR